MTFQGGFRKGSARLKDGEGAQADTGTVVLANQLENAMRAIRRIVASLRIKVDDTAFALCLAAFAIAFAGSAVVSGPQSANKVAATASEQPVSGAFTGTYVNGAPVYRMPTISVSASRAVEMARIEQEDLRAQANARAGSSS
jgi:hypothetical protein